mgnify:FL=1
MISSIKFFYNGLRLNGSRSLVRVGYSLDLDAQTVTIYARSGETLPRELFTVENDTDLYTDYFDDDRAELTQAHPLYKFAAYAAARADLRRQNARADYLRDRIAAPNTWDAMHPDALTVELEAVDARRAALEAIPDPGQPTAADLAAVDQMNQDAENAARAAAQAEQQRRREEALAESANTRAIVREEIAAHPLDMNAPAVDFTFSESPAFNDFAADDGIASLVCSIPAAEAIVRRLDLYYNPEQVAPHCYEKTDFTVYYPAEDGTFETYSGRLDLGTEYGGLVQHIRRHADTLRNGNGYHTPDDNDRAEAARVDALADLLDACLVPASTPAEHPAQGCEPAAAQAPAEHPAGDAGESVDAPAGIISVTFAPELLDALRREYPAQAGQSIPAEHPAGADIPAQAPAGDTGNCAGRNNPRTIPARGAWVPSVVSSAHPASNPAEHPAQGDEPAAREEVEQLRDALRSLSDVELAACLFHVDPASSDARPMSAVFLREMSRRDPASSFATFKAWRAGNIPPEVRALLDSLADGDPDAGGD